MISSIDAVYFDGISSQNWPVQINNNNDGSITINGLPQQIYLRISELDITPRIANIPRNIFLPDGDKLEVNNNQFIDQLIRQTTGHNLIHFVHILESKSRYVLIAMVATIIIMASGFLYGIPALSKQIAYSLPKATDRALGKGTLDILDKATFEPTDLDKSTQQHLIRMFHQMNQTLSNDSSLQLLFRKSESVGPNAFALPSGIIVITDALILLAENDNEIRSILAHEIGHIEHRHSLRMVLQSSATSLLIAVMVGEVSSVASLAATIPTVLLHTKYSREFETEADNFSLDYLNNNNISPLYFSSIMERMLAAAPEIGNTPTFLSTHPDTAARILKYEQASNN